MLTEGEPVRVRMENISKSFGAIKSLDRVNLVLRAGEVLGLVGDNGAGKSTLSKMLSGAIVPDEGRIVLDGKEVRFASPADARRQRVEMVYQDLALCDTVDVAGNLLLGRESIRWVLGVPLMDKSRMHAEAKEMLGHLGIRMPCDKAEGREPVRRPASEHRHRPGGFLRSARSDHGRADGRARGGGSRCGARTHQDGQREGRQRHPHHAPAAGPVPRLRSHHGHVRRPQCRRAPDRRHQHRGDRQPDRRAQIPVRVGGRDTGKGA